MDHKTPPDSDFMRGLARAKARERERRWRSQDGERIYVWDGSHGELEAYNKRGKHLGVVDPATGCMIEDAVPGRTIDV